ncbi:MAG: hypothetical protein HPY58_02315 [Firmicutes bacterium]|nr:hypothetical protein [Bacillota bacterium]
MGQSHPVYRFHEGFRLRPSLPATQVLERGRYFLTLGLVLLRDRGQRGVAPSDSHPGETAAEFQGKDQSKPRSGNYP